LLFKGTNKIDVLYRLSSLTPLQDARRMAIKPISEGVADFISGFYINDNLRETVANQIRKRLLGSPKLLGNKSILRAASGSRRQHPLISIKWLKPHDCP
jgi:hypothetical protein